MPRYAFFQAFSENSIFSPERVESSSEASFPYAYGGWRSEGALLRPSYLGTMLVPLVVIASVFTFTGIVYCSDMPWVEPSSEAPGHLKISVSFLPSLPKIVIYPDVLIHLLEKLFQGLGGAFRRNIMLLVLGKVP